MSKGHPKPQPGDSGFHGPRDDASHTAQGAKPVNSGDQRESPAGEQLGDSYADGENPKGPGDHSGTPRAGQVDYAQAQSAGSPSRYVSDATKQGPAALRQEDEQFDAEYLQWRTEQMRNLDDDYRSWRSESHQNFSAEFHDWRNKRTATDRAVNIGNPGHVEPGKAGANDFTGGKTSKPDKI